MVRNGIVELARFQARKPFVAVFPSQKLRGAMHGGKATLPDISSRGQSLVRGFEFSDIVVTVGSTVLP